MSTTYWCTTTDVFDLYQRHARLHADGLVKMTGTFRPAKLDNYCYDFVFVPGEGDLVQVIPVFAQTLIDIVAFDGDRWGAVTGQGTHLGTITNPLVVHDTPDSWIEGDIGVLPLAKSFFKTIGLADSIVARNAEHAEQIAELAFISPAIAFGLDVNAAKQIAFDKISF